MNNSLDRDQEKFERRQDYYITAGNETSRALNKQLILFATAVLSLSLFIFGYEEVLKQLGYFDKGVMVLAWVSLAFSIVFGILQFFIAIDFFKNWSRAMSSSIKEILKVKEGKEELGGLDVRIMNCQRKEASLKTSEIPFYGQVIFTVFALIFLLSVMIKFLLGFNFLIVLWWIASRCML